MAKKNQIEYRYYDIPEGHYCMALLGDAWERHYGDSNRIRHFHNYLEIGYCYWGNGELTIEDITVNYKGDLVTLIPKNIPHTTNSDGEDGICKWEYLFVDMDNFIRHEMQFQRLGIEEVVSLVNKQSHVIQISKNPRLGNIIKCILDEYREREAHYENAIKGYLRALVIEMIRTNELMSSSLTLAEKRISNYMETALAYIEEHYSEDIRQLDIAKVCGLSESHFRRIFVESIGMKPSDYLNMIRVKKACEYLSNEETPVEEIGYRVGFQNSSTFNRNFRKIIGTTPLQWRKESKKSSGKIRSLKITAKKGW